jgi:hypothetical protein
MSELVCQGISLGRVILTELYHYYEKEGYDEGYRKFVIIAISFMLIVWGIYGCIQLLKQCGWLSNGETIQTIENNQPKSIEDANASQMRNIEGVNATCAQCLTDAKPTSHLNILTDYEHNKDDDLVKALSQMEKEISKGIKTITETRKTQDKTEVGRKSHDREIADSIDFSCKRTFD